ncbi:MAG: hypothetical protein IJS17_00920 [Clostridia bacterium]|nr:hypothetical protein [Clostridia bacterium]
MKKTVKKRAFISAIAMLIVSAIALTSSTFAWFSMSKKAEIEQMDLTVTSPEGILISANAKAWTSTLTPEQIFPDGTTQDRMNAYDGNINFLPTDLKPVSCSFRVVTGDLPRFLTTALNDQGQGTISIINQSTTTADAAGFVAFDLFVKLAESKTVYFDESVFTDTSGQKTLTSLRVAFQNIGNFTINTDANTITAARGMGTTKMLEVDAINRSDDALGAGRTAGKVQTQYLTSAGAATVNSDSVFALGDATAASLVTGDQSKDAKSLELNAGITKLRIYIWIEGQDIDCRNSIGGAELGVALKFTID